MPAYILDIISLDEQLLKRRVCRRVLKSARKNLLGNLKAHTPPPWWWRPAHDL